MLRLSCPLMLVSIFLAVSGVVSAQDPSSQPGSDPPKPLLLVSFERQTIKENDAIEVRVWLTNEWNRGLTAVRLHIDAPATLKWNEATCANRQHDWDSVTNVNQFDFGAIGPNTVSRKVLCVQSGSSVDVGDFNILFTADYSWSNNGAERHSIVTSEKQLKASLFGSDTVAGVPITLAAFIVPGLFCWLVLGWLRFPWTIGGLGLGDKLIYSVIISLPLLWIVNWLTADQSVGISLGKLGVYAVTGVAAGFVVGIGPRLQMLFSEKTTANKERLRKEREIKSDDSAEELLGKLLNLYPDYKNPRAELRDPEGTIYGGSLAAETDEIVGIVGWFQIDKSKIPAEKQAAIPELQAATRSLDRFNIARKYGLPLETRNPLTIAGKDSPDSFFTISRKDAEVKTLNGQGVEEPLVVV